MRVIKEEALISNPHLIMYDLSKKLSPDSKVKIRSPPRLDTDVIIGLRDAAVKAFKVIHLAESFFLGSEAYSDHYLVAINLMIVIATSSVLSSRAEQVRSGIKISSILRCLPKRRLGTMDESRKGQIGWDLKTPYGLNFKRFTQTQLCSQALT